jgi:NADH-quinone oxidoreductase subunit C
MTLDTIKSDLEAAMPGCHVEIIPNPSPSAQHSLLVDAEHGLAIATFLRDAPHLQLDFCSNVTGIDWPAKEISTKVKVTKSVDGVKKEVEEVQKTTTPGFHLPSLTPIWRSAEFQEREIFDLYGVIFDGHPDLRRLLMWDEFVDHPMRRDYVDPDDYEYEPTAHDEVLARANQHTAETGGQ